MTMANAKTGGALSTATAPTHRTYDVIVAGARSAGASTALLLARAGLRVLVVDPVPPQRDPLSTHALMRGAVLQLDRWGLLDEVRKSGAPPIRRTRFHYGSKKVEVDIRPRHGVDALYAPRRTVLDPMLARAAKEAGAELRYGWAVGGVLRNRRDRVVGAVLKGPGVDPFAVRAQLLIGADGIHSAVARLVEAPVDLACHHATANLYQYWTGLSPDAYEWYYGPGLAAGEIPTNDGASCVFLSAPPARLKGLGRAARQSLFLEGLEASAPGLPSRLGQPASTLRGFLGRPGYLKRAHGPGWALVGDAGYFKDPLTAHGITDALRDAEILARAVVSGGDTSLLRYQNQRDALSRNLLRVSDRIASLEWTLAELSELHLELNREMKAEVRFLAELDPPTVEHRSQPTATEGPADRLPGLLWHPTTLTGSEGAGVDGERPVRAAAQAG